MSDGITDAYRDQRRGEYYRDFLVSLADYLGNKTPEIFQALIEIASAVDGVPRGLMTGQTNLAKGLELLIAQLIENDRRTWGQLLLTAVDCCPDEAYEKLKRLSPFADMILIKVDYGDGCARGLGGEIQLVLDQIIRDKNNILTYDTDKYLVTVPKHALDQASVTWLNSAYPHIKGPRKARLT